MEMEMAVMDGVDFSKLPEGCISNVLSLTSPPEVCRFAMVSHVFFSAAASDTVWERFIPSDIDEILLRAVDHIECSSKRELYFRLCNPILINDGKMSFFLEKSSGKKCYMLSAKLLSITWADTSHYWRWISVDNTRFEEVAELLDVCWLEIRGSLDTRQLSQLTKYAAYLVFNLTEASRGLDHPSQETSVKLGAHVSSHITRLMTPLETEYSAYGYDWMENELSDHSDNDDYEDLVAQVIELQSTTEVVSREDGWMEIELGEFDTECGDDGEVEMNFMEIKGGHWKRGLIVQGIEIRPRK
ncbi:F-box protein At2g02240-like [Dioscorea cayenensis subsp. rotundata]|uniref:F-box protein At2g02240-like n=1 Tax=Dioscorea cayennensis subsp. rotundata TaxID=55577 RepID=A0AB40APB7_DIOCR|nr:F-box protein At2g02240-like [Dioscorea cayenensis subsp. rotundata]